jgi:hypothetical protein
LHEDIDPFQLTLERLLEIIKDPEYKPVLLEALKANIEHQKAETRDLESQTLARLERTHQIHKEKFR